MPLHRSALCLLALFVAMPVAPQLASGATGAAGIPTLSAALGAIGTAQAASKFKGKTKYERKMNEHFDDYRVVFVGDDAAAAAVVAEIESEAGDEDVPLVESDAWLHGAATIASLPKMDATLTLTLYDTGNASLMSFSGTLGTDGTVTLTAEATKDAGTVCDTASKVACTSEPSTATSADTSADTSVDIEVLASEVFAASGGYDLSLDLAGADTYAVAYAEITVTESDETTTCSKETAECTTSGSTSTSKVEVGWDAIGSVWEGVLTLPPEGLAEVKIKTYDASGKKLDSATSKLGLPWLDDGAGVNTLATDEDPLTSLGLLSLRPGYGRCAWSKHCASPWQMVIHSEGWSASSTLPTQAQVELTDGGTITMTSAILWRMRKRPELLYQAWDDTLRDYITEIECNPIYNDSEQEHNPLWGCGGKLNISGGDFAISGATVSDLSTPVCSNGTCVSLITDGAGGFDLSVSTYGSDAQKLADEIELTITAFDDEGVEVASDTVFVEFDEEISVVFGNEVSFSEDPIGLDLSGKVSLLGAADKKGKQETLAKGKFYASFSRDGDGDVSMAGADKDAVSARGDIVVAGSSVGFELMTDTNKDGVLNPPPLTPVFRNGSGTKTAASQTSAKPELL